MIDYIGPAEREPENVPSVDGSIQEATDVGAYDQTSTHTCGHSGGVMQGFTYCRVAVISHGGQEEVFYSDKSCKEEELGDTSIVGNDFFSCEESCHHFGSDSGGITKVHQGEVTEEKVHGSVEARVQQNQLDHSQVSTQSDEVDERDDNEEWDL